MKNRLSTWAFSHRSVVRTLAPSEHESAYDEPLALAHPYRGSL